MLVTQFAPDSWSYLGGVVAEGQTLLAARQFAAAETALEQSVPGLTRTMGAGHQQVITAMHALWQTRAWLGDAAAAETALAALLAGYEPADQALLAPLLYSLGVAQRLNGHDAAALETQTRALALFGEGPAARLDRLHVETERGLAQVALGRFDEARRLLRPVVADFGTLQLALTPQAADARVALGRACLGLNLHAEAAAVLADADTFWRAHDPSSRWAAEAASLLAAAHTTVTP